MTTDLAARKSKTRKTHWIPVVAGFIRQGQKILVGQRPENKMLPGQWEFPGGKVEAGESPEQALARELKEELGIDADIGELKLACSHSYGDINILIMFYDVLFWKGQPKAQHHMMLEWIEPQDLLKKSIPEANKKILDRIFKALGVPWPESR